MNGTAKERRKQDKAHRTLLRSRPHPFTAKSGNFDVMVHKSTRTPGAWQATFIDDEGPWGDTERDCWRELLEVLRYELDWTSVEAAKPKRFRPNSSRASVKKQAESGGVLFSLLDTYSRDEWERMSVFLDTLAEGNPDRKLLPRKVRLADDDGELSLTDRAESVWDFLRGNTDAVYEIDPYGYSDVDPDRDQSIPTRALHTVRYAPDIDERPEHYVYLEPMLTYARQQAGGDVERANIAVVEQLIEENPDAFVGQLYEVVSADGQGYAFRLTADHPALIDVLEALAAHPVIDEEALSNVQQQMQEESFYEAAGEFIRQLEAKLDIEIDADEEEAAVAELFWDKLGGAGDDGQAHGEDWHFPIAAMVDATELSDLSEHDIPYEEEP